jgi:predicted RNA-binding protein
MRQQVEVNIGEDVVVIKRSGRPATVAAILGTDVDENGQLTRIWLDRLVHQTNESTLGRCDVSGAFVSVLANVG